MENVLIVAYLLIVLALIAVILMQRSEGGALGIGGNAGGLVSARGSANLLTRTTAILATLFFATAIGLTILSELNRRTDSILDSVTQGTEQPGSVLDALNAMQPATGDAPAQGAAAPQESDLPVPAAQPAEQAPATPAEAAPAATTPAEPAATAPVETAPATQPTQPTK